MFKVLFRHLVKKVRVPAGNSKTNLNVYVPQRQFMDFEEFSQVSRDYWTRLKKSLEDIHQENPDSKLTCTDETIRFEIPTFCLNLDKNSQEQSLQLIIGDGISHNYIYDKSRECWVSSTDGHQIDELLCREITRKCLGFFNI